MKKKKKQKKENSGNWFFDAALDFFLLFFVPRVQYQGDIKSLVPFLFSRPGLFVFEGGKNLCDDYCKTIFLSWRERN